ncbi:hypothetical protein PGT21_017075 [Puccinia graminis f. sp. tritici]|uniref:Uncharacterized protein n=1 Tax=Puccinia graminis f. sp. tritici TaxID=56615 RepID=A0A5B0NNJ6_PUCGR|nr:hypothetical protein PGT21_017075 [Puccinia graminis f. sp. tritici]
MIAYIKYQVGYLPVEMGGEFSRSLHILVARSHEICKLQLSDREFSISARGQAKPSLFSYILLVVERIEATRRAFRTHHQAVWIWDFKSD